MLGIEEGDLSQIALQVIHVGDLGVSLFVVDGLIGSVKVRLFNLLALRIVFESYLDIALVIVLWLARGAKIALFNGVPTVVTDPRDLRPSFRRAYGVILFIQTGLFNEATVGVIR